jgi:hypothetical protein
VYIYMIYIYIYIHTYKNIFGLSSSVPLCVRRHTANGAAHSNDADAEAQRRAQILDQRRDRLSTRDAH